jgi:hypothetical protein
MRLLGFLVVVLSLAVVVAALVGGDAAALGMFLGLGITGSGVGALWWSIDLVARMSRGGKAGFGSFIVVLAFLVKLPVIVLTGLYAQRLGPGAGEAFLVGLGMVYGAVFFYGLIDGVRKAREERSSES